MSFVNFKTAKRLIKIITIGVSISASAWEIDLSRRQMDFDKTSDVNMRLPASVETVEKIDVTKKLFEMVEPLQDVVILNTESGFVPSSLRLKNGGNYRIHVVNVHSKEKNLSFVLDAFSQSYPTFFGEEKSFQLTPKVDGIFSYQCPETAQQGKIIVFSDSNRAPASN